MSQEKRVIDARALKSGGFIRQTEPEFFVARIHIFGGVVEADQIAKVAELAKKYGRGYCHLTFQKSIEVPYVKLEEMESLKAELEANGMSMANCGPRVRAVTNCQGCTINPYGRVDAIRLAKLADERFFGLDCPAKFKISYSGCPIGCANPQENDLGFHGMVEPQLIPELCNGCTLCVRLCQSRAGAALTMNKDTNLPEYNGSRCVFDGECIYCCPTKAWVVKRQGHSVWVGGKHGRFPRWSNRVADFVSDEDTLEIIEKTVAWYNANARRGERFGTCLDRLGLGKYKKEVLGDRWTTAHNWTRHGDRPKGIKYQVLHTWDRGGEE